MSIWHPASGITYDQYLQANSFARDITGQVRSSGKALEATVSEQTKALVASNHQLSTAFGVGFNAIDSTLQWGFNRLDYVLQDLGASIDSLHAQFNYNMGLLLQELHTHNRLLSDLLNKLDAIHITLQSPLLTQAREHYRIGCERLRKQLLDKALEAFLEAEKKNDTDFFIEFHIGQLYLYGAHEDVNLLDLDRAKKHLLLAARYAKAETSVDPNFARFAAEALLHASFACYFRLGDKDIVDNSDKRMSLLQEAKRLSTEATKFNPKLHEAFYHLAKYSALLGEPESSVPYLEAAVIADRDYAIKVDIDHAFDPVRSHVLALLSRLKNTNKVEGQTKLNEATQLLNEFSQWHPEESSSLGGLFAKSKKDFATAQEHHNSQTYFGFLDAIALLNPLIETLPQLKSKRIDELRNQVKETIRTARAKLPLRYSDEVRKRIQTINALLSQAESQLNQGTYESLSSALSIAQAAHLSSAAAQNLAWEEDAEEGRRREAKREAERLQERRNQASREYSGTGAGLGAIIGFLGGCASCLSQAGKVSSWELLGHPFIGLFIGLAVGAFLGAMIGQTKS